MNWRWKGRWKSRQLELECNLSLWLFIPPKIKGGVSKRGRGLSGSFSPRQRKARLHLAATACEGTPRLQAGRGLLMWSRSGNCVWLTKRNLCTSSALAHSRGATEFPLGACLMAGYAEQRKRQPAPENCLTLPLASGPRVTRLRHSHRNFPLAWGVQASDRLRLFTMSQEVIRVDTGKIELAVGGADEGLRRGRGSWGLMRCGGSWPPDAGSSK